MPPFFFPDNSSDPDVSEEVIGQEEMERIGFPSIDEQPQYYFEDDLLTCPPRQKNAYSSSVSNAMNKVSSHASQGAIRRIDAKQLSTNDRSKNSMIDATKKENGEYYGLQINAMHNAKDRRAFSTIRSDPFLNEGSQNQTQPLRRLVGLEKRNSHRTSPKKRCDTAYVFTAPLALDSDEILDAKSSIRDSGVSDYLFHTGNTLSNEQKRQHQTYLPPELTSSQVDNRNITHHHDEGAAGPQRLAVSKVKKTRFLENHSMAQQNQVSPNELVSQKQIEEDLRLEGKAQQRVEKKNVQEMYPTEDFYRTNPRGLNHEDGAENDKDSIERKYLNIKRSIHTSVFKTLQEFLVRINEQKGMSNEKRKRYKRLLRELEEMETKFARHTGDYLGKFDQILSTVLNELHDTSGYK